MTLKQHATLATTCFLLLLSPLGAPALGIIIASVCPTDPTIIADGPFALSYSYCGISRPIEQYFQGMMFLPVIAAAGLGPIFGGIVALAWVTAAFVLPIFFLWNVGQMISTGCNQHS